MPSKKAYKQQVAYMSSQIQDLVDDINSGKFNPVTGMSRNTIDYTSMLSLKDCIQCSNRYTWEGLLELTNLTSQQLESLFYQYGSLCFFEHEGKLQISNYAQLGQLNPYGRLDKIRPIDFAGHSYPVELSVISKGNEEVIGDEALDGQKDKHYAIIINDYTPVYTTMQCTPRSRVNLNTTIKDQVEVFTQLNNNITLSVKRALALCDNEDQKRVVQKQLEGLIYTSSPVVAVAKEKDGTSGLQGKMEMFNFANNFDCQNYCLQLDYYDKIRSQFNGIPSPDTFDKKERKVTSEVEDSGTRTDLVLYDGLESRRYGLELVKKYLRVESIDSLNVELSQVLKAKETNKEEVRDNGNNTTQPPKEDIQ